MYYYNKSKNNFALIKILILLITITTTKLPRTLYFIIKFKSQRLNLFKIKKP